MATRLRSPGAQRAQLQQVAAPLERRHIPMQKLGRRGLALAVLQVRCGWAPASGPMPMRQRRRSPLLRALQALGAAQRRVAATQACWQMAWG